jgi:hypothetical protein
MWPVWSLQQGLHGQGSCSEAVSASSSYAIVLGEPKRGSKVVTGTASILGFEASVLFDLGAAHSFISIVFVRLSRLVVRTLKPS